MSRQYKQNVYALLFMILGFAFGGYIVVADLAPVSVANQIVGMTLVTAVMVLVLPHLIKSVYTLKQYMDGETA